MQSQSLSKWCSLLAREPAESRAISSAVDTLLLSVAKRAMACEFEVLLNQHQFSHGADQAHAVLELVEKLESLLSVYKARSDLSQVNRLGFQHPVAVSVDSFRLVELAYDLHAATEGAFDITAGILSEAWGFSRREGRMPTTEDIQAALEKVGTRHLQLDRSLKTIAVARPGIKLNSGGIGKGYALDRCAGSLLDAGISDFMMHGGRSSVIARGSRAHREVGGGWLVALMHPWRWEEQIGTIRLRDQALATSGSGKQFFHFGGRRFSHIIDPRTGWPAESTMSVTVVCASGAVADALATAFFVMGPEQTSIFCREHPFISAIVIHSGRAGQRLSIETHNISTDMWNPAFDSSGPSTGKC